MVKLSPDGLRLEKLTPEAREMPTPEALIEAQSWLRAGCPASWYEYREQRSVPAVIRTLLLLVDTLPSLFDVYAYATEDNKEFYRQLAELRKK